MSDSQQVRGNSQEDDLGAVLLNRKRGDQMSKNEIPELTDNTVENIKIMAPYLNEMAQNQVFGLVLGLIKSDEKKEPEDDG